MKLNSNFQLSLLLLAVPAAVLAQYPTSPSNPVPVAQPAAEPANAPVDTNLNLEEACLQASQPIPIGSNPVTIRQFTLPDAGTMTVELTYAGIGWLAFGFTEAGSMVGSTSVIGLPDTAQGPTNPGKYFMSDRNLAGVNLVADNEQVQTDSSITQTDTETVLRFTYPLVDEGVVDIEADGSGTFLFAYGSSNELAYHAGRGSFPLTLSPCLITPEGEVEQNNQTVTPITVEDEVPNRQAWLAHGALMALAWAIFVPIAIGSSMLRSLLPLPDGAWFQIHRGVNLLSMVMVLVAFSLAVSTLNSEAFEGESVDHFTDAEGLPTHRSTGLAIFILAMLQVLVAFFRPHPVSHDEDDKADGDEEEGGDEEKPKPKSGLLRLVWECQHRLFGATLLGLAWYNCYSGFDLLSTRYGENYDKSNVMWGLIGGICGLILVLYAYIKIRGS